MSTGKLLIRPLGLCRGRITLGSAARLRKLASSISICGLEPSAFAKADDGRGGGSFNLHMQRNVETVSTICVRGEDILGSKHLALQKQPTLPAVITTERRAYVAARSLHSSARGEALVSDRNVPSRERGESARPRLKKAERVEPPVRKLRVEKGFTSSEDAPSTSGRDRDRPARPSRNDRSTGGFKTGGPKLSRNSTTPRNPNAERSAIYEMLEGRSKAPKKSLGQNFVIDADVIQRVVAAAGVGPGDVVLEIGPGTGNLTRALAAAGADKIIAVEKDGELAAMLATAWEGSDQVRQSLS